MLKQRKVKVRVGLYVCVLLNADFISQTKGLMTLFQNIDKNTQFVLWHRLINCIALAKQGDNALGTVRTSITTPMPRLCPSAAKSNNHHYQSKVIVCVSVISGLLIIDRVALAKQGDNVLGSVRPSPRQCALSRLKVKGQGQLSGAQWLILGARLCRVQRRAKKSHYQSRVFVCVSNNCTDAGDRLLIACIPEDMK